MAFVGPSVGVVVVAGRLLSGAERIIAFAFAVVFLSFNVHGWLTAARARPSPISIDRLRLLFGDEIQVRLDWRLLKETPTIRVAQSHTDERTSYGGWWHSWYLGSEGTEVSFEA
jgi:hypothetical protein